MQFVKIAVNAYRRSRGSAPVSGRGALIWGAWALAIAAGGWLFGLVPVIVLVPENWLLRHPRRSIAIAAAFGWIVVLVKFEVWKLLLPYHSLAVRMFTLYSLLLVVYATVSAAVYLRLIAPKSKSRVGPGFAHPNLGLVGSSA